MEIGFLTAFLGGTLALLSPCSALLLPAFFASTVGARLHLVVHGAVFYLGMTFTLVPLGLGLGVLGSFVLTERGLLVAITSILLVAFGTAQLFGLGFDLSRMLPGASRLQQHATSRTGLGRTLLLGAISGVAGFCAGPILGAILTLAVAQGSPWGAGALLAVYGAGMVVPLMVVAALWKRLGAGGQRLLRGRSFTMFGRGFHSTSVLTGTLIIAVGIMFWLTNGLISMPSPVPIDVQMWMQEQSSMFAKPIVDFLGIIALAGLAIGVWAFKRRRTSDDRPHGEVIDAGTRR